MYPLRVRTTKSSLCRAQLDRMPSRTLSGSNAIKYCCRSSVTICWALRLDCAVPNPA